MALNITGIEEGATPSEPQNQEPGQPATVAPPPAPKKGRVLGRPLNGLRARNTIPGYTPRWVWTDPDNLARRIDQGYQYCNRETGLPIEGEQPSDAPAGAWKRRDMVLMAIPDEVRQLTVDAQNKQSLFQQKAIKDRLQAEMNAGAGGGVAARASGQIIIG